MWAGDGVDVGRDDMHVVEAMAMLMNTAKVDEKTKCDINVTRTQNSKQSNTKTSNSTRPMQPKTQQALTK